MSETLTLSEAATELGFSKSATRKAARVENWPIAKRVGNVHLYYAEDIREYRDHRHRTKLVKALGWHGRGLYRVDDIDIECPVCGAFAVEWPAPPYLSEKFLCVEGHEGEKQL
jgi:hypothetical protein